MEFKTPKLFFHFYFLLFWLLFYLFFTDFFYIFFKERFLFLVNIGLSFSDFFIFGLKLFGDLFDKYVPRRQNKKFNRYPWLDRDLRHLRNARDISKNSPQYYDLFNITFSRKSQIINWEYSMDSLVLKRVHEIRDLGVILRPVRFVLIKIRTKSI